MSRITYKNITLKEMFEDLVKWQLGEDNEYGGEFYYQDGDGNFDEITQVDLMDSRFKTNDDDFSEYDWELEKSNIYIKEEVEE
jgi:hypothetical protein